MKDLIKLTNKKPGKTGDSHSDNLSMLLKNSMENLKKMTQLLSEKYLFLTIMMGITFW